MNVSQHTARFRDTLCLAVSHFEATGEKRPRLRESRRLVFDSPSHSGFRRISNVLRSLLLLVVLTSLVGAETTLWALDARGGQFMGFSSLSGFKKSPGEQTGEWLLTSP